MNLRVWVLRFEERTDGDLSQTGAHRLADRVFGTHARSVRSPL